MTARAVRVPITADSVASPRLVYGGLDPAGDPERSDAYPALYFVIAGEGRLGRVTFEGLDAVRAARGETLPYSLAMPRAAGGWVFVVEESPWLAERHAYELERYSTPLLDAYQHYVFQFHDEFAEVIAQGIWLDRADPARPYDRIDQHPLADLSLGLAAERFQSAGIAWELRRSPRADSDLVRGSELCSQRLWQFNLVLDGRSREGASIWLRTRNGQLTSRLARPWPAGQIAEQPGMAGPADFADPWETCVAKIAERRRELGR